MTSVQIEKFQEDMALLALYELGGQATAVEVEAQLKRKLGAKWFHFFFEETNAAKMQ